MGWAGVETRRDREREKGDARQILPQVPLGDFCAASAAAAAELSSFIISPRASDFSL
jgi:hypothetical protein